MGFRNLPLFYMRLTVECGGVLGEHFACSRSPTSGEVQPDFDPVKITRMSPQEVTSSLRGLECSTSAAAARAEACTQSGRRFQNGTNLGIDGLVSADRNNKATLPLTTPRCTIKSSAKDLSPRIVKLLTAGGNQGLF
jgi:hypothetical protein